MNISKAIVGILIWTASHQAVQSQQIGVFGSHWDAGDAGSEIGAGALLRLRSGPGLLMDLRGSVYEFENSTAVGTRTIQVIPIEWAVLSRLAPAPDFVPYAGGGIGYYIADGDFETGGGSSSLDIGNELAFFILGGFDIRINRSFSVFAEAKYIWAKFDEVDAEDETPQPNIKVNGLTLNLGLMLKW